MRRVLISAAVLLVIVAFVFIAGGFSSRPGDPTYKLEFDNAFGLVNDAPFKVAGVPAGKISSIELNQKDFHAVVTVQVTTKGFGAFRSDASCQSRPQSLIGEYFVDCQPGQYGKPLKSGATLPASHTFSTIPADLLADIMRLPQRERFSIVINELGAAVAARSEDIQTALRRAVPAIDQTDNLLNLLGNDSKTLQNLTRDSNTVITALANNKAQVNRFIIEANRTATATATQDTNLRLTFARLPGLLQQLRPTLVDLSSAITANTPVLQNLDSASGEINTLFTNLPAFSRSAVPAVKSLGQASVTGKSAVVAAKPTVTALNQFAKPTPELAQNLSIVLNDLDTQNRAVERDPRSPGGKGFSGLQALLGYVFNQALAVNTYGPFGHMLAVDAFFSKMCSPYATPATIAMALKAYGPQYRECYSWLGPNQPGVNETDPTNPSAPVPDPGGAPPGKAGPATSAAKLTVADVAAEQKAGKASGSGSAGNASASSGSAANSASGILSSRSIGRVVSGAAGASGGSGSSSSGQAQQLLNYLLAP
jgi:virulence factor Mce-like protein